MGSAIAPLVVARLESPDDSEVTVRTGCRPAAFGSAPAYQHDPDPREPDDEPQPEHGPERSEPRDDREQAGHADRRAEVVQQSRERRRTHGRPTHEQYPHAAGDLVAATQPGPDGPQRQPDGLGLRRSRP